MSDEQEAPRRRRRETAPPPPAQGSVIKGAVLVAVALLIGFILLQDGGDSISTAAVGSNDPAVTTTTAAAEVTTTTAALRPAAEVKVLVANGSGVQGAAGAQTDSLTTLGYTTGSPTDANADVTTSVIYFVAGYQPEAAALAESLTLDPATAVVALPTPAPVDDTQEAQLVLVLGPDLASAN